MKIRSWKSAASVALVAIISAVFVAAPAYAAGELARANIGSSSAVTIANTWSDVNGETYVLTVTARFSGHTSSGARLDSFRLCYSGPAWSSIWVSPYARNAEGNIWDSGAGRQLTKGANAPAPCIDYTVGKYYSAGSDDVVRIVSRITGTTAKLETVAAYYR